MRQTKLHIPLSLGGTTINIVGVLAQRDQPPHPEHAAEATIVDPRVNVNYPSEPAPVRSTTEGRKVALILHGVLAHKDQTYHRLLAASLPIDSFRFDFRANAETPGPWNMASFDLDLQDMRACIDYLTDRLGYTVEVIIAHSRGALDGFKFLATQCNDAVEPRKRVPYYVALGARWRMKKIHDRDPLYQPAFAAEGFYRWKVKVAGQKREVHIYPKDVEDFAVWPIEKYVAEFPTKTDVLLVSGTADETVPVSDSAYYINALTGPHRRPGSASLRLIDDANHNFKGHYDELVDIIVTWLQSRLDLSRQGTAAAGGIRDHDLRAETTLQKSWESSSSSASSSSVPGSVSAGRSAVAKGKL
ncbi:uncharacterized protein PFL1_01896 [Pseudozyma flocculosa PF-1]|uniref:Peptidase S9 prolyl oligopeptidase catalytic domain-containing protein n=1 Tax=Pseudozyma flocculosa TaxID=84751 RepID=A0A5C3EZD8_9BASI|nr:uncharacterized protein PFL1_01896 [Pseudozyma flocculosa PF-1]EPQ30370.1 hypothetical protein PFL1_01896 [Pseudozyma flocculosa PF-1]SPO37442.1 uncharacterized protein PSFLO_02916 [Pseudozyma flocculosa]